jgi:hypothetical protein
MNGEAVANDAAKEESQLAQQAHALEEFQSQVEEELQVLKQRLDRFLLPRIDMTKENVGPVEDRYVAARSPHADWVGDRADRERAIRDELRDLVRRVDT